MIDLDAILDDSVRPELPGGEPQLAGALDDRSAGRCVGQRVRLVPNGRAIDGKPEPIGPSVGAKRGL